MNLSPMSLSVALLLTTATAQSAASPEERDREVIFPNVTLSVEPKTNFAGMTGDEISALLAASTAKSALIDSTFASSSISRHKLPVELTARDFMGKVYGVLDPSLTKSETLEQSRRILNLRPSEDNMGLWLESADGYQVNYYGLTPPSLTAMALFERDSVTNFGFFFMFPYTASTKEKSNAEQAEFCSVLLQELNDLGVVEGAVPDPDEPDLFDVAARYEGRAVDIRLLDEQNGENDSGRYVLMLCVTR